MLLNLSFISFMAKLYCTYPNWNVSPSGIIWYDVHVVHDSFLNFTCLNWVGTKWYYFLFRLKKRLRNVNDEFNVTNRFYRKNENSPIFQILATVSLAARGEIKNWQRNDWITKYPEKLMHAIVHHIRTYYIG